MDELFGMMRRRGAWRRTLSASFSPKIKGLSSQSRNAGKSAGGAEETGEKAGRENRLERND